MAENGIKVSQIAKDLKVTSKDITERLSGFGITVKGTTVLTEEQLGLIFDIYTNLHDLGDAPIEKPAKKVVKKEEPKAEEPKKEETKKDTCVSNPSNCEAALKALLEDLYDNDTIEDETYTKCMTLLEGKTPVASDKMSKREIDEMFNFVH